MYRLPERCTDFSEGAGRIVHHVRGRQRQQREAWDRRHNGRAACLEPEWIREINRIASRVSVEVEAAGEADGVFLGEMTGPPPVGPSHARKPR